MDFIRAWQESGIRKMKEESKRKSKLYEIEYELPTLTSVRTAHIITDSKHDAIRTVLNGNPNIIIKNVKVTD